MTNTQHTAKHTPGPWTVHVVSDETVEMRIKAGTEILAGVCDLGSYRIVEQEGNANLFAAAPAMYEALKDLIGDTGDLADGSVAELQCHWCGRDYDDMPSGSFCTSDDCPGYRARQAIAKAEGSH